MTIRIYYPTIQINAKIELKLAQAHYLFKVLRQKPNDTIFIFNKKDGEFECTITEISKNKCVVLPKKLIKKFTDTKKIICVFSIIKTKNAELIIQKCTEIGVHEFLPLQTERTNQEELNITRLNTIAIEASEQCGRLDIPAIRTPITISELFKMQNENRAFVLLNQNGESNFNNGNFVETYIICGPEGGFSQNEIENLSNFCTKIKISQNILRAETAAILGCGLAFL